MNRPRVIVHAQASVDGRLTTAPDVLLLFGDARWQAVAGSTGVYERLLAELQPQATLEGSGSLMLEGATPEALPPVEGDPAPLYDDFLPEDVLHRLGNTRWFTVVDGRGRVRWLYTGEPGKAYPGLEDWHLLVWVSRATPPEYLAYLRQEQVPYLVAGDGRVDLGHALEKMKARLGVACLLSTAGGRLNGALLRAGLVDAISLEFFPAVIGGFDTPSLFDSPALQPDEHPTRLRLLSCQVVDGSHVWLRYEVMREEQ